MLPIQQENNNQNEQLKVKEICWQGKDINYDDFMKQYHVQAIEFEEAEELKLNLSSSQVQQEKVEINVKKICNQQVDGADYGKWIFKNLKKLTVITENSLLTRVDFIANFSNYPYINEIELICNSSDIAHSFLHITRTLPQIDRILCPDYFSRQFGAYSLESSAFYAESLESWNGIEDKIENLKILIESSTFKKALESLLKCSSVKLLEMDILSLDSVEESINSLINGLQIKCIQLNKLILRVYIEQLLPPIKIDSFQQQCELELIYISKFQEVSTQKILRFSFFLLDQQSIKISSFFNLNEQQLKLDFNTRHLTDWQSNEDDENPNNGEASDLEELQRLMIKIAETQIKGIEINFQNSQTMFRSRWVQILKILCANQKLSSVKIFCASLSPQLSAMSLVKLIKAGKENALVNQSYLKGKSLNITIHQMSHNVLNFLLASNCFRINASVFNQIIIETDTIMGDFEPFSAYFSTERFPLSTIMVTIKNPNIDITDLLVTTFANKKTISNLADYFQLKQEGKELYEQTQLQFRKPSQTNLYLKKKYLASELINNIGINEIPEYLVKKIDRYLNQLRYYQSAQENLEEFEIVLEKLTFLKQLWKLEKAAIQQQNLPFQLSVFFKVLAPYLPINPKMVAADMYYE